RPRRKHLIAAAGLLAGAVGLSRLGPIGGLPVFGFAAALCTIFGIALLAPGILTLVARVGARPIGLLFGIEGRLAHANLAGAIPRLAVLVGALAGGRSMLGAIAIMIGSFRETVIYWVGQTLQADLYMATARR